MPAWLLLLLLPLCTFTAPLSTHAETKVLTAEATYTMGDGETPTVAEARALHNAKRMAVEQAGTYLQSHTKTKNFQLTDDELQAITGALIEVEVLEKNRTVVGEGIRFWVKIKATVRTEKAEELANRLREKESRVDLVNQYKETQAKYDRLDKEIEALKKQLRQASSDSERKKAVNKIAKSEEKYVNFLKSGTYLLFGQASGFKHQRGVDVVFYELSADSQSEGGTTRTCFIKLLAWTTNLRLVTMHWTLMAERAGPNTIKSRSVLKVEVRLLNYEDVFQDPEPIKVYKASLQSSSGTTMKKLTVVPAQLEHNFLDASGNMDLFVELMPGILTDGLILAYQDEIGGFDTRIRITEPLSEEVAKRLMSCMDSLRHDVLEK